MDKNNDMYGQDRKKEGMQNESADYRKNPMQNDAGSQSGVRKQDGCDNPSQQVRPQGASEWKQQGASQQNTGGKTDGQAANDPYGVRKDRQSGTSAYGSQTTQTTPGAGGTGKRPGTADTDKTDAQKKHNTPGGSY